MLSFLYSSHHPYIVFNKDRNSMSFVGFCVTKDGDLIDPTSGKNKIIHRAMISQELMKGLRFQGVKFDDDKSSNQ